jgi:hypothetical protein
MGFFTSPQDLLDWVKQNPSWNKAAQRIAQAVGPQAQEIEDELKESVTLIFARRDLVAAKGLFNLLGKYGLSDQHMKIAKQLKKTAFLGGISHSIEPNGELRLVADSVARQTLKEMKEEQPDFDSDAVMYDVLEGIVANSELEWIQPEWVGALTSAPMLGITGEPRPMKEGERGGVGMGSVNVVGNWDNQTWVSDVLKAWAFMNYQVTSPQQELLEKGEAIFQYGGEVVQKNASQRNPMKKEATYIQPVVTYNASLRICPKLPRSTGQLISTMNCRENCLDSIYFDDEPERIYCAEALWRKHVMDKFSREWKDKKTGEWVGGYINNRFHVFPTAGTPANPDVPRDHGNRMELALNERSRQPRPHEYSTERRLEEQRNPGSTKSITLAKTAGMVGDEGLRCELCGGENVEGNEAYGSESGGPIACNDCIVNSNLKPCPSGCKCVIEPDKKWCEDCEKEREREMNFDLESPIPPSDFEKSIGVGASIRNVLLKQASSGNVIKLAETKIPDSSRMAQVFSACLDLHAEGLDNATAAQRISDKFKMPVPAVVQIQAGALRKLTRHSSDVYGMQKQAAAPCVHCRQSTATLPCTICGKPTCSTCKDMTLTEQHACKVCGANVNTDAVALGLQPPATQANQAPIPEATRPFADENLK